MPHKNPERVPMSLQAMDDPAAHHEPQHVLGREGAMPLKKIEKDGIYLDSEGRYFFMAAGDYTERDVVYSHQRGSRRAVDAAPQNKARKASPETKAKSAPKDKE